MSVAADQLSPLRPAARLHFAHVLARRLRWCLWLALMPLGCSTGWASGVALQLTRIEATPPGRVQAVVTVGGSAGDASDLAAENFEVREGDVRLDSAQVGLKAQPLGDVRGHQAVIVVDVGKPIGAVERAPLAQALSRLIDRVRFHQTVTLAVFDGSSSLKVLASYRQSQLEKPLARDRGVSQLLDFQPQDRSSSLYTAIVEGSKLLTTRLASVEAPLPPVGSLVVVARRPDLAGRTDEAAARAAIERQRTFLLKVGAWSHDSSLDWVGRDGLRGAASLSTLGTPVDELGRLIDDHFIRSYVLTYCSPARAGQRRVDIVLRVDGDDGAREASASGEINAAGFGPRCRS